MHGCLLHNEVVAYDGACCMPEQHHLWLQQLKSPCDYVNIVVSVIDTDTSSGSIIVVCIIVDVVIHYTGDLADCIQPKMTHLTAPCCAQNTLCTEQLFWLTQVAKKA